MTAGQTAMVYQKPMTFQDQEGKAKLIRLHNSESYAAGTMETWDVRFLKDGSAGAIYRRRFWVEKEAA